VEAQEQALVEVDQALAEVVVVVAQAAHKLNIVVKRNEAVSKLMRQPFFFYTLKS